MAFSVNATIFNKSPFIQRLLEKNCENKYTENLLGKLLSDFPPEVKSVDLWEFDGKKGFAKKYDSTYQMTKVFLYELSNIICFSLQVQEDRGLSIQCTIQNLSHQNQK